MVDSNSGNGIQSASGFQGLENTPLARIGYYNSIIAKGWENDFLPRIVSSEIDGRIMECNQIVQFLKQPDVGPWRTYEKNQELVPDLVSPDGFTMRLCYANYKDIKFDKLDVRRICDRFESFEESFLDSTYQTLAAMWRMEVLTAMVLEADAQNKGVSAGRMGNINLGAPSAPRVITGASIAREAAKLKRVLIEQNRWVEGMMHLIISPAISEQFVESPYASALNMGSCVDCSLLVTGQLPGQVLGFDVIQTNSLCAVIDPATQTECYYIIAGHKQAFAFAGDIIEGELVRPARYFGIEYQMLEVHGYKAILPEAIAIGYWTV